MSLPTRQSIPKATFPCSDPYCADGCAHPASRLYWYEDGKAWICKNCWEYVLWPSDPKTGEPLLHKERISLAEFIKAKKLKAAALLDRPRAG
jgi:hypothetical protein